MPFACFEYRYRMLHQVHTRFSFSRHSSLLSNKTSISSIAWSNSSGSFTAIQLAFISSRIFFLYFFSSILYHSLSALISCKIKCGEDLTFNLSITFCPIILEPLGCVNGCSTSILRSKFMSC